MKPFAFRLEALARLYDNQRDLLRGQLAAALAEHHRQLAAANAFRTRLAEQCEQDRQARRGSSIGVQQLVQQERYVRELHSELARLAGPLAAAAAEVEASRERLAEAERQRQMLARLRDRDLTAHRQAEGREETKQLDELAARRTSLTRCGETE